MLKNLILIFSLISIISCKSTESSLYDENEDKFEFKTHQLTAVYRISPLVQSSYGVKTLRKQPVKKIFHFSHFIYEANEIKVNESDLTLLDSLLQKVFFEKNTDFINKIDGRYSGDLLFVFQKKTELPIMPEETYIMLNRTKWKYIGSIGWDKFTLNKDITDKIYKKLKQ